MTISNQLIMDPLDDLPGLRVFERVVALGSLSGAARELGLSPAAASKRLAALEKRLGCSLIQRSTRRLAITDEGQLLYAHAQRALDELAQATESLSRQRGEVGGLLRITAPNSFGRRLLVPLLPGFCARHPGIRLQLQLSDDVQNLIEHGHDMAIRYGVLPDSGLVARPLLSNRRVLCAAPEYLQRHGTPQSLDELDHHACLVISASSTAEWRFDLGSQSQHVHPNPFVVCNDGEAVHAMALQGMGIALKSWWDIADDLHNGRLVQVLPDHAVMTAPISAVYLRGVRPARITVFVEYLLQAFSRLEPSERQDWPEKGAKHPKT